MLRQKKIFILLLTLFTFFSVSDFFGTQTVHAADYRVEQWRVVELSFTSRKSYGNPFLDVDRVATFSGPGGKRIKRPAFWDGGKIWKVGFAPIQQGLWSYTTTATNTSDSGLHNKSGTIQANTYTGSLDIYKHGFLKMWTWFVCLWGDVADKSVCVVLRQLPHVPVGGGGGM